VSRSGSGNTPVAARNVTSATLAPGTRITSGGRCRRWVRWATSSVPSSTSGF
jgi:hypothetical protein